MRRFGPRELILYLLIPLMIVSAFIALRQADQKETPTYSQIRTLFLQEQVEYFTLEDNTLTLTLRGQTGNGETVRITYRVADPDLFYFDMRELVNRQLESGVLKGYDYPPGVESSWWYNLIPYLVAAAVLCLFCYLMLRQRSAGSGGGSPGGAARFSRARTRPAPTPTYSSTKSEPEMDRKWTPASPATALAMRVLPVPGGPTSSTPLGMRAPKLVNF